MSLHQMSLLLISAIVNASVSLGGSKVKRENLSNKNHHSVAEGHQVFQIITAEHGCNNKDIIPASCSSCRCTQ